MAVKLAEALFNSTSHWPPWDWHPGAAAALHAGPRGAPTAGGRRFSSKCPQHLGRCEGRGMMVSKRGSLSLQTACTLGAGGEGACPQQHQSWGWGAGTHGCTTYGPSGRGGGCERGGHARPWTTVGGGREGHRYGLDWGERPCPGGLLREGVSGQHVGKSLCLSPAEATTRGWAL